MRNRTKIICTIGPASDSYEMLLKMYEAGMDIARLNMSHGDHSWHAKVIANIKKLNDTVPIPIGMLLDTKGPEIRTGKTEMDLHVGDTVHVTVSADVVVSEKSIYIEYEDLITSVRIGDKITLDNGLINLEILDKGERSMTCKVLDGGFLKAKRHVNLPGIRVNLPAITESDKSDILFGMEHGIDFIALSFVREAQDVRDLKVLLGERCKQVKIIAKIENQEGVRNMEEILDEVDGIMVARGDLGVEIDIEDVPNEQRRMIKLCQERGKRVIVATHMLESMINNPLPTRAEVTDVSNAVYQETDAIMLSGETSVGKYPLKAIEQMVKIARKAETMPGMKVPQNSRKTTKKEYMAVAAAQLAEDLRVRGIVVLTQSGVSADYVANCHPSARIFAFTYVPKTLRFLRLSRSVMPYMMEYKESREQALQNALQILKEQADFEPGEEVVAISDTVIGNDTVDAIQLRHIP